MMFSSDVIAGRFKRAGMFLNLKRVRPVMVLLFIPFLSVVLLCA